MIGEAVRVTSRIHDYRMCPICGSWVGLRHNRVGAEPIFTFHGPLRGSLC
jgi:hypothetical protein